MKVKIWDALNSEEEYAREFDVFDPGEPHDANHIWIRDRVQMFTERQWANNDYADTTEINVRTPDGTLIEFDVYAERAVNFRAVPRAKK